MRARLLLLALLAAACATAPTTPGGPVPAASVPGALWTRALTRVAWPSRDSHTALVFRDRLWVLGGWGTGPLQDVWSSPDGLEWQAVGDAPWPARKSHTGVVFQDRLWILGGGTGGTGQANDVWSSPDGAAWTQVTAEAPWSRRLNHASAVFRHRIWVLGGWGLTEGAAGAGEGNLNDVWWSADGATWRPATGQAQWLPRNGHASVVFQDRIWIIGGWSHFIGGTSVNDLWSSGH